MIVNVGVVDRWLCGRWLPYDEKGRKKVKGKEARDDGGIESIGVGHGDGDDGCC